MSTLTWDHAKDLLLLAMFGSLATLIGTQLRALVRSVETLNISIAILLQRVGNHEERITKIEGAL